MGNDHLEEIHEAYLKRRALRALMTEAKEQLDILNAEYEYQRKSLEHATETLLALQNMSKESEEQEKYARVYDHHTLGDQSSEAERKYLITKLKSETQEMLLEQLRGTFQVAQEQLEEARIKYVNAHYDYKQQMEADKLKDEHRERTTKANIIHMIKDAEIVRSFLQKTKLKEEEEEAAYNARKSDLDRKILQDFQGCEAEFKKLYESFLNENLKKELNLKNIGSYLRWSDKN